MIEWSPAVSAAVVHTAMPAVTLIAEQPLMDEAPSRKSTVPVGVPAEPESDAVKLTTCPIMDGLTELDRPSVGFTFVTQFPPSVPVPLIRNVAVALQPAAIVIDPVIVTGVIGEPLPFAPL